MARSPAIARINPERVLLTLPLRPSAPCAWKLGFRLHCLNSCDAPGFLECFRGERPSESSHLYLLKQIVWRIRGTLFVSRPDTAQCDLLSRLGCSDGVALDESLVRVDVYGNSILRITPVVQVIAVPRVIDVDLIVVRTSCLTSILATDRRHRRRSHRIGSGDIRQPSTQDSYSCGMHDQDQSNHDNCPQESGSRCNRRVAASRDVQTASCVRDVPATRLPTHHSALRLR